MAVGIFNKLLGGIGIYKKNLIFYILLLGLAFLLYYFLSGQIGQAQTLPSAQNDKVFAKIVVQRDGSVYVNGKKTSGIVKEGKDYDELNYKVLDNSGYFFDQIKAEVGLPDEFISGQVRQRVYAVSGVDDYRTYSQGKNLVYEGYGLGPAAIFSISAQLPKGMIVWPFYHQIWSLLSYNSFIIWMIIGISLPVLTLLILLIMLVKTWRGNYVPAPIQARTNPPSDLPPAIVGVLIDGTISTREIAATLLDLANRQYISIYSKSLDDHQANFSFGQRKPVELNKAALRDFELVLLSKIFEGKRFATTREQFVERLGRHLFSRKIAEVYLAIYQKAIEMGYFVDNPLDTQRRYKNFGYVMGTLALVGFFGGAFFLPDPKYLLIFWAGMFFAALSVISLAAKLPIKTPQALQEIDGWLSFKKFLSDRQSLGMAEANQGLFEKYLPYAIVLRCELEWTRRFEHRPFQPPNWYDSEAGVSSLEDFSQNLFSIIGYVGRSLSGIREPTVE